MKKEAIPKTLAHFLALLKNWMKRSENHQRNHIKVLISLQVTSHLHILISPRALITSLLETNLVRVINHQNHHHRTIRNLVIRTVIKVPLSLNIHPVLPHVIINQRIRRVIKKKIKGRNKSILLRKSNLQSQILVKNWRCCQISWMRTLEILTMLLMDSRRCLLALMKRTNFNGYLRNISQEPTLT